MRSRSGGTRDRFRSTSPTETLAPDQPRFIRATSALASEAAPPARDRGFGLWLLYSESAEGRTTLRAAYRHASGASLGSCQSPPGGRSSGLSARSEHRSEERRVGKEGRSRWS